jgi:hypothetical protein
MQDRPGPVLDAGDKSWAPAAVHPALKSHFSSKIYFALCNFPTGTSECKTYMKAFGNSLSYPPGGLSPRLRLQSPLKRAEKHIKAA